MAVDVTQRLDDLHDVIDTLQGPLRGNIRWMKRNGIVNVRDGRFHYRMVPKNKCGAEFWGRVWQIMEQNNGVPPWYLDCDMLSTILCAGLIVSGEAKDAKIRAIQVLDTAHVQVVAKGRVLDPSVWLGMPVPSGMERAIYDLNFPGMVIS